MGVCLWTRERQDREDEISKEESVKDCVICGKAFKALGKAKTCSQSCSRELELQGGRKRAQEWTRLHGAYAQRYGVQPKQP